MSEHLPECPAASGEVLPCVCGEQPRWTDGNVISPEGSGSISYADHVAAIAEAEQRLLRDWTTATHDAKDRGYDRGYERGQRDAIAKAVAAVEGLPHDFYCTSRDENFPKSCNCPVSEAIAAIKALAE